MELYQLHSFLEVARTRNFTRAAERLHIAQPALSEQIRRLEEELGARLFDRGRRESPLTAAGKVLAERAEGLLEGVESARRAVMDVVGLRAGRVVVGAIPSVSACLLPPVVAGFRAKYPQVELVLVEGTSELVAEWVENGRADLGVVQLPIATQRLASADLLCEPFVVLVGAGHGLAGGGPIALADLAGEPFVVYKGRAREVALAACLAAGFAPKIACETGELETVRSLVGAGLGVALLPQLAARRSGGECVCLPLKPPGLTRQLALVTPRGRELTGATEVFAQRLVETTRRAAKGAPLLPEVSDSSDPRGPQ
jgi:DNA-binding transcriptional LysR family regulator